MWYDDRPQDTADGESVMDIEYNGGWIDRHKDGEVIHTFGQKMSREDNSKRSKIKGEEIYPEGGDMQLMRYAAELCNNINPCLLYTSPSPRDRQKSRMPSSA